MKVLFCDDDPQECENAAKAALQGSAGKIEYDLLHSENLKRALIEFFRAFDDSLGGKEWSTAFDGYDVIVIDNNLTHLKMEGTRLTAEAIAGYVRAISNTPYVVSLNINTDVDFDLRYLIGDFTTKADLALNVSHLESRSLWSGNKGGGEFSPWYWPALFEVAGRRRTQIEFVAQNVDQSILRALEFPEAALASLSRHAKGALSPEAEDEQQSEKPLTEVTFRDFFLSSSKSIPAKEDRVALSEGGSVAILAKVIAGELDAWFRRDVLGPQDVLVDVPHLLLRMPFVLGDDAASLDSWNGVVNAKEPPFGLNAALFEQHLKVALFPSGCWLESPAFWWPNLKADTALNGLFLKSEVEWGDYVFCEDTSSFAPRSGADLEPVEFAAEYDGAWNRRHVARLKEFKYAPRSRLAM